MIQRQELNEYWKQLWLKKTDESHIDEVNPHLKEFFYLFNANGDGKMSGKRILVPLCGKTRDLKWLYGKGLTVVGVELSKKAVESFFVENHLKHTIENNESRKTTIYHHDNNLRIYVNDIFELDSDALGGKFDFVWDRAAMVAMLYNQQKEYCSHIRELLTPNGQALLELVEYDESMYSGPPYNITANDLKLLLNRKFEIEQLFSRRSDQLPDFYRTIEFESVRTMYLIKKN